MAIRAKIDGLPRLQRRLKAIGTEGVDEVARAIAVSALDVQSQAQRSIQRGARSGVIVTRGGTAHQRSAPGEFPKTDTGRLVSQISHEIDTDRLGASVGTNIEYGPYLEFGTRTMAARPWLQPTFERLKGKIRDRIAKAMRTAERKATRKG